MPRNVTYQIVDQADGRFTVLVTIGPDRTYQRTDVATLAEVEDWVDGLRVLMAACGAPVIAADSAGQPVAVPEALTAAAARNGTGQE